MILINPQIPQIDRLTPKFGFRIIRPLRRTECGRIFSPPKGAIPPLRYGKMSVCLYVPQNFIKNPINPKIWI